MTDTELVDPASEDWLRTSLQRRAALAVGVEDRVAAAFAAVLDQGRSEVARPGGARWRRRPPLWAMAVAAAVLVVAGTTVVISHGRSDAREVRLRPSTTSGIEHWAPSVWPTAVDGPVEASVESQPSPDDPVPFELGSWLLTRDGHAIGIATVENVAMAAMGPTGADGSTGIVVGGHQAVWRTSTGLHGLQISLLPGRTLSLSSRTADQTTLASLAVGFDMTTGQPTGKNLPSGWGITPDTDGVASAAFGGVLLGSTRVERDSTTGNGIQVVLNEHTVPDAQAAVDTVRELRGDEATSDHIFGAHPVVTVPVADSPADQGVVWALSDHTVGELFTNLLPLSDLVPTFNSVQALSDAGWSALVEATPKQAPTHLVDGFPLLPGETPLKSGRIGRFRWMVTLEQMADSPISTVSGDNGTFADLHVLDANGRVELGGGTSVGGYGMGAFAHGPDVLAVSGFVPVGFKLGSLTVLGKPVDATIVPLPGLDTEFIFGLLDAATTPGFPSLDVDLTGMRADGTAFDSKKPNGG